MNPLQLPNYDYIIVGAGSAGCVLANRLSADPENRVLLLEAGGSDRNFWLKLPVGYFRSINDKRFSRHFKTEAQGGTACREINWPRGRVIGGSSSINGLIFIRGQHHDFDRWEEMGATGWSYREVLPHFRSLETFGGEPSQLRGAYGEMPVSVLRNNHPFCSAWVEAANQYGMPRNNDFNGETTEGAGSYQLSIGKRWRASAARAFLQPVLDRPNLTLMSRVLVSRVLIEEGSGGTTPRAVGVEWHEDGRKAEAFAAREVILCAGAIQSPQLLQLSGIGPDDVLEKAGVRQIVSSPGVGGNLQDHYQMRTIVRMKKPISLNDDVRNPFRLARMGIDWLLYGRGPLTIGAGQVGGATSTKYADPGRPDVQFNVMPLSVDKPGDPLHRYSGFTAAVWQCHPESRGRVDIVSDDPAAAPRIVTNYLSTERDCATLVEGVKILREIYRQPAFRDLWDEEIVPGPSAKSDEEILDAARRGGGTVYHPVGTCRIGSDEAAVVDPDLRVRGVAGLRVVDASVMPRITSANTNAPTLMIAEKASSIIREQAKHHGQQARGGRRSRNTGKST
ncbi:GMC family oxidoreductase [Microbaculum sp. FT89]|uniref:GMC family oxidoreductase n=1 Tax=Microbaculum sp. FT89 TaxID=3447298 RepID=UPI003F52D1F4